VNNKVGRLKQQLATTTQRDLTEFNHASPPCLTDFGDKLNKGEGKNDVFMARIVTSTP
jgi:CRISPR/Cas system CSM-associated protein Csm2 small subunit